MVSAWVNKAGLMLGRAKTGEKSNKITAIPQLLEMLHKSCHSSIYKKSPPHWSTTFD